MDRAFWDIRFLLQPEEKSPFGCPAPLSAPTQKARSRNVNINPGSTRLFHRGSDYSHPRNLYSHARNPYSHPPGIFIHIAPESGIHMPRNTHTDSAQTPVLAAVLAVFGALDMPLVYFSIWFFRTQHPQPVLGGGGSIDPRVLHVWLINWAAFQCFGLLVFWSTSTPTTASRQKQSSGDSRVLAIRPADNCSKVAIEFVTHRLRALTPI
jgi:hypothetical protein